jgi:hypothetical protein
VLVASLAAVALLLPATAGTAGAAPCPGVHHGLVTTVDLPATAYAYNDDAVVVPGGGTRHADAIVALTDRTVYRSPDGGCMWAPVLTFDPAAVSPWRSSPTASFFSVGVSAKRADGRHTLYVVAGESTSTITPAEPVATYTSVDDGLHWTVHEPAVTDLAGDVPRCTPYGTRVVPTAAPRTAYLVCLDGSFSEFPLSIGPPECDVAVYVTADDGATWHAVAGRYTDPALVSTSNFGGCGEVAPSDMFVPDPVAPRTVVRSGWCDTAIRRSADGGRTYRPWLALPRVPPYCWIGMSAATVPGLGRTVLACDVGGLQVASARGTQDAKVRVRSSETGVFTGCAFVPGTTRVLGFYLDGQKRCRVYSYDVARRGYSPPRYAPYDTKSGCAWSTGNVTPVSAPGAAAVWVQSTGRSGSLLRLAG